ncbi:class I SAM-dependent methyltransferase [Sphingomonas immobilis]|uniref:Class I SAM-dependent methyltransferase n=1 Tax=Sphingomonas immobilis TaxID=3063997 RepID=A0ABT8ZZU1_9SPHN|nr:class I SAM-dependent methyltransferase [Sphingomonas sp. CA1-15]MDO7841972.1 class I SAM-dependent methyltransferase [Sphingomonas sp. CA1-15]
MFQQFGKWGFIAPRDIGLFLRSARTDTTLADLRTTVGQQAAFDTVYASGDPWASSDPRYFYQRRKYEVLAGLVPDRRFSRALDLGCGHGNLARKLAAKADSVLGVDIAGVAMEQAAITHADVPNLRFEQGDALDLPARYDGQFDLITIADMIYYLPPPIEDAWLKDLATSVARLLSPGGILLLANHYVYARDKDSRMSRRIHDAFSWSPSLRVVSQHRRPFYLVSVLAG